MTDNTDSLKGKWIEYEGMASGWMAGRPNRRRVPADFTAYVVQDHGNGWLDLSHIKFNGEHIAHIGIAHHEDVVRTLHVSPQNDPA